MSRRALVFDEGARHGCLTLHEPGRAPEEVRTDAVDPLLAQCAHFLSCVRRSDAGGGNAAHALAVVRVLEAGARSMRARGTPVELT